MLIILVGGGFLKRLPMNAKIVDSGEQEKITSSQVSNFSASIVTFSCKVVLAFDKKFVIDFKRDGCHLEIPVPARDNNS